MICICGHRRSCHKDGRSNGIRIIAELRKHWCAKCLSGVNPFHTFKLDNLKYLERLYEKRCKAISL